MKILIPVDGSEQGNAALDLVPSRSTPIGDRPDLLLLDVQPMISARVTRPVGRDEAQAFQRAQADEMLRPARGGFGGRCGHRTGSGSLGQGRH